MPKKKTATENHAVYAMVFLIGVAIGLLMFWVMISGERFHLIATRKAIMPDIIRPSSPPLIDEYADPLIVDHATSTLDVVWRELVPMNASKIYAGLTTVSNRIFGPDSVKVDLHISAGWKLDEVGFVKGGSYDGHRVLLLEQIQPTEIGGDAVSYDRLLLSPDGRELRILSQYGSGAAYASQLPIFISAPNLRIPTLEPSENVTLANGRKLFLQTNSQYGDMLFGQTFGSVISELKKLAVTDAGQIVFGHPNGSAYLIAPDGEPVQYVSVIPTSTESNLQIRWTGGSTSTHYLPYLWSPCGFHASVDVVPEAKMNSALLKVGGKTAEGDSLYISKDPLNDSLFKEAYELHDPAIPLVPFEEYVTQNPNAIFFWKDAFGRWIMYRKTELEPEVMGCG